MEKPEHYIWRSREVARLLSLVESERRYYEDILTILPVPVAIVQASGRFLSANRAFLQSQQISIAELSALSVARVLPNVPLLAGVHEGWDLLRIQRWDDEESDLVLVQRPAEAAPAADPESVEFALQEAAAAASARLAGRVLHEANNLLMVLSGYGEEILDALPPGSPLREDMREILRSTDRIKGMSTQLQALASPPKAFRTSFDLVAFLRAMSAREPGITVKSSLAALPVTADRSQLEQVLLTLLRYAQRPLSAAAQAPARVVISGFGPSLKEDLELLSPAARASNGALSAIPALLSESRVQWRIELSPDSATLHLQFASDAAAAPAPAKRILVVDDEEGIRTLVRKVLERQGFQVTEAESGDAAVVLLERDGAPYDLLISDMMMPGIDGRSLANRISQMRPGIRILFISGYTEDAEVQSGRLPAGTAFLPKPFPHSALIDAVNRLLA
jgi:two-component system, cell cycle sensor histidine kinase and response regulator CckA